MIPALAVLLAAVLAGDTAPAPEMVAPGVISTEFDEFGGALTPDGDTMYFSRGVTRSYTYAILRSHRTRAGWSTPEIAPFSGRFRDHDPILAPDGRRLYFASDRPIDGVRPTTYHIWVMDRTPTGLSDPRVLGAPFDQFGFLWFLSETRDGVIYFNAQPDNGPARIYMTRRTATGYTAPELLPSEVNIPNWDAREPYISPDDSFMVFDAGPAGAVNLYDLYVSDHRNGAWTPARKLTALSTPTRDYSPRITADGQWLYYTTEHGFADPPLDRALTYEEMERSLHGVLNGLGNIYRVPIAAVHDTTPSLDSINRAYIKAYADSDAKAVIAFYDTGATELLDQGRMVHGHDALLDYWSKWIAHNGRIGLSVLVASSWVTGPRLYETGTYITRFHTKKGATDSVSGNYARIWKRESDGAWKIEAVFDTPK